MRDLFEALSLYTNNNWILLGVSILLSLVISIIFEKYIYTAIFKLLKKTPGRINILERSWIALKRPVSVVIVSSAVYIVLTTFDFTIEQYRLLKLVYESAIIVLISFIFIQFISTFNPKSKLVIESYNSIESEKYNNIMFNELSNNYYAPYFVRLIQVFIFFLCGYFILNSWGKDVSSVLTTLGFISVAIAFSLRDTFSNIFSGIVIVLEKSFKIGDTIETDKIEGTVQDISFRSTKIITFNKEEITVPNSMMINLPLNNKALSKMRKLEVYIALEYVPHDKFEKKIIEKFNTTKLDENELANCQKLFMYDGKMVYKFFEFTLLEGSDYVDWKQNYMQEILDYCLDNDYKVHYIGFESLDLEKVIKK